MSATFTPPPYTSPHITSVEIWQQNCPRFGVRKSLHGGDRSPHRMNRDVNSASYGVLFSTYMALFRNWGDRSCAVGNTPLHFQEKTRHAGDTEHTRLAVIKAYPVNFIQHLKAHLLRVRNLSMAKLRNLRLYFNKKKDGS